MFNLKKIYDFKKHASSVMKKQDAEIAFMRASSNIISDKASPIFKDPYYLGFEIVKTSDTFTKMIGIYVFRINKRFLYAPVFYIDGKIKGTDLLYIVDEKLFVTLTPEWCEYLLGKYNSQQGEGVDGKISDNSKQQLDLQWLAYPQQGFNKGASESSKFYNKHRSPLVAFDFIKEASDDISSDLSQSIKNFFSTEDPDTYRPLYHYIKCAGYDAFNKLAECMKHDLNFANDVVGLCKESDYIPNDVIEEEHNRIKSSSNKSNENKPLITFYKGSFNNDVKKYSSNDEFLRNHIDKGYSIEDKREEKDCSIALEDPSTFDNFVSSDVMFKGMNKLPGIYKILTSDGKLINTYVVSGNSDNGKIPAIIISLEKDHPGIIIYKDTNYINGDLVYEAPVGEHPSQNPTFNTIVAVDVDGTEENLEDSLNTVIFDKPEKGKSYFIYEPNSAYLSDEAFYVDDVEPLSNGGYKVTVYTYNFQNRCYLAQKLTQGEDLQITINPFCKTPMYDLKIFPKSVKWIEVPVTKEFICDIINRDSTSDLLRSDTDDYFYQLTICDLVPGTWECIYNSMNTDLALKSASAHYNNYDNSYSLRIFDTEFNNLNKVASVVTLMANAGLRESEAEKVLDNAKEYNTYKFFHKKLAGRIILNPDPEFFESFDSDLGITEQHPQTRVLITEGHYNMPPASRYGDKMPLFISEATNNIEKNSVNTDVVNNSLLDVATPSALADLARITGRSSLFEHGVVGSLSKITSANGFVEEFLPDMRRGLDKFGRLLFLIITKPQDFIDNYGSDEIENLENSVTSVFKQTGELVLNLLKKSHSVIENTVSID